MSKLQNFREKAGEVTDRVMDVYDDYGLPITAIGSAALYFGLNALAPHTTFDEKVDEAEARIVVNYVVPATEKVADVLGIMPEPTQPDITDYQFVDPNQYQPVPLQRD